MIDVVQKIYDAMQDPAVQNVRRRYALYPSSASIEQDGEIVGACHREEYYKWMMATPTDAIVNPEYSLSAIAGNCLHDMLVGLFQNTSHKTGLQVLSAEQSFFNPDYLLSGRTDILLLDTETNTPVGADFKTVSPYGSSQAMLMPRIKDILQCAVYLHEHQQNIDSDHEMVEEWLIIYLAREQSYHISKYKHGSPFKVLWQFSIKFNDKKEVIVEDQNGNTTNTEITIDQVYDRYNTLLDLIKARTLPDRDFEEQYSEDKIAGLLKAEKLTRKPDREQVQKWLDKGAKPGKLNMVMGDKECDFCAYSSLCWSDTPDIYSTDLKELYSIKKKGTKPPIIEQELF
jgi:hypothetical protein